MTLRHMKIFITLCENDYNTTKTSEKLHMSQPAVSLAIKELEDYYSTKLFDRIGRHLLINEAGREYLTSCKRIIELYEQTDKGMKEWDENGILRIGASITIGTKFLPSYIKMFNSMYPNTKVKVTIGSSDAIEKMLINNELDIVLSEGVVHSTSLNVIEYMDDQLVIIASNQSKFRNEQVLTFEEFQNENILLREEGSGTRETIDNIILSQGHAITPLWEAMSTSALVNAVISNLGISILPYRLVLGALKRGLVIKLNLQGIEFNRKFKIITHQEKYLTTSMKRFIELAKNFEFNYPLESTVDIY